MVQIIHPTIDIQRVSVVRPCDGGSQRVFATGLSACLRMEHPEYALFLHHARSSLEHGVPVGFIVSEAGELVELTYSHQSAVRHVRPDADDPSRLIVEFWAYSPICYLTKDHPEFERISSTLERAATLDEVVIFANHMRMVEGQTETWWKIMDVRAA
jgi:hypothetical protein